MRRQRKLKKDLLVHTCRNNFGNSVGNVIYIPIGLEKVVIKLMVSESLKYLLHTSKIKKLQENISS